MKDSVLLPAMENVCSSDDLRPVMGYVLLTKEKFVATDAHVMVWHDTDKFFDKDFIEKIPEDGILIHKEDWKKMSKCAFFQWHKGMVKINFAKKRPVIIEVETQENVGKYPNWNAVIPPMEDGPVPLPEIGVNPDILIRAKKAMGENVVGLKLSFSGARRAIMISDIANHETGKYNGLVMPQLLDSNY